MTSDTIKQSRHGLHKMMACQKCANEKQMRLLKDGLCATCSKGKAKTVVNVSTSGSLTVDALDRLPEKKHEIVPDDSTSMIRDKRQRELMEDELQRQDEYKVDYYDGPADTFEQRYEPTPKRQKCNGQPQAQSHDQHNESSVSSLAGYGFVKNRDILVVAHTDGQVIELLKELVNCSNNEGVRAQKLQGICHMLSQEAVYNFLTEMSGSKLTDIMLLVQNRSKWLTQQQLVGLVMGSIALGGGCWQGAVKMLNNKDTQSRENAIASLKPYLKRVFNQQLTDWVSIYWGVTEQSQLDLMHSLSFKSSGVDYNVLMLSLATTVQDITIFVEFACAFVMTALPCAELLFSSIIQHTKQQKISFEELLELTNILQSSSYDSVIESASGSLSAMQIHKWKEFILSKSAAAKIANSSSVQTFLDELSQAYGNTSQFAGDATKQFKDFQILLAEAPLKPNDRQLALAQYCIGKLYGDVQRQLWVVPSGQGKARIAASAAALALMSGAIAKVHLVFESKHLMERDKSDFEAYWLLLNYDEGQVQYHLGCDFKPAEGELVIIDEIDVIMFKDPVKFNEVMSGCLVLGFTATPDNFKADGAENRILSLLKFQKYHYVLGQQNAGPPDLSFDEVVACGSVPKKADFIKTQAQNGPVLVYCKQPLTEALIENGCDPLVVSIDTDPEILRSLNNILGTGLYGVVVAQGQFAMRGYDYRAQNCQLTLVIDQSFENLREAIQGYNRVGRFGDQCKRIRFSDAALVDQKAALVYSGVLLRAALALETKPVQLKKIQVKKIGAFATSKLPHKRVGALLTGFFKPKAQ